MKIYEIIKPAIPTGSVYQFTTDFEVEYEVRFGRKTGNVLHAVVVFGVLNDEYEGEEYVITNKGDVFRVMNTISLVIQLYMEQHPNVHTYEFTGLLKETDEEEQMGQRTKLYLRFLPRIFPKKNWSTIITGNRILAKKIERS